VNTKAPHYPLHPQHSFLFLPPLLSDHRFQEELQKEYFESMLFYLHGCGMLMIAFPYLLFEQPQMQ
jgi:hypothetical protein